MVYLNNAGTSFPKPPEVGRAVGEIIATEPSEARKRAEHALAIVARRLGVDTRQLLVTSSCTQALEVGVTELPWQSGDVVVTSQLEHHGLIRPLLHLHRSLGVERLSSPYAPGTPFSLEFLREVLRHHSVRLVAVTAASNVTGEILPLAEIAELAHESGALLLVDAAQTFGLLDEDVSCYGCDLLAFAGHKNPLGPQGVGGLWAADHVPFAAGSAFCEVGERGGCGTTRPGYCDVGGVNLAGLTGLGEGLQAFGRQRSEKMGAARELAYELAWQARGIDDVMVFGHEVGESTATVSLLHQRLPLERAERYFREHGLVVRAGMHCAPEALSAIGAPEGTIRISFGPSNCQKDAEAVLALLARL